jgi:3-deoxy-7-phosphoheptulonate synthase
VIPLSDAAGDTVRQARQEISRVLAGDDDRLVVVTGPCSIHDPTAAIAYAERLADLARQVADALLIVMRVYVEKPRTRLGWKGLLNDPRLDGSHDLTSGLRVSRTTMADVLDVGLPVGCEFLDPIIPRYLADAVAWGSIGARTVQSQVHRQFTSGLAMPVGIKNATNGSIEDAIDAIVAAGKGHVFPAITDDGVAAAVSTTGNPECHLVLRGGSEAPNYGPESVATAVKQLAAAGLRTNLFVDASHGNCGKDHERQPGVIADIAERIAAGERSIAGLMIESFLTAGRQDLVLGSKERLRFGQSITDACVSWDQTVHLIDTLADAVDKRRSAERMAVAG